MASEKVRLMISKDTVFVIENADRIREYAANAKPETVAKVCDELMYIAAMCHNIRDLLRKTDEDWARIDQAARDLRSAVVGRTV